jgi:hypothetical protein
MRGQSPTLLQLVDAGRLADRPTDADSERVLRAIQARLGLEVGVAGAASLKTVLEDFSGALALRTLAKTAAGVALIVAGFAFLRWLASGTVTFRDASAATAAASAATSSEVSAATEPTQQSQQYALAKTNADIPSKQDQIAPPATPTAPRGSARLHDSLTEEVEILSRAEKELLGGRPANALLLLSVHEHKYKHGKLTEERTAARVQALCALGRVKEANVLLAELSPQSLHGTPTRQVCFAAKNASADR